MSERVGITDRNGVALDFSTDEVRAAFKEWPLPFRMRLAAEAVDSANARQAVTHPPVMDREWNASSLRAWADSWEREDAVAAETEAAVEALAKDLMEANPFRQKLFGWADISEELRGDYLSQARALFAAGWRREVR